MSRVLIIHGERDFARRVFREEQRGYWTAALPLVLEKHGIQGITVAGPERLKERAIWDEFDAVLIGRLPEGSWSAAAAQRAVLARGGAVVEAPLPEPVRAALGIAGSISETVEGRLKVSSERLRALGAAYGVAPGGVVGSGTISSVQRTGELDWDKLGVPISPEQADAWREPGWLVEDWTVPEDLQLEVLAEWSGGETPRTPSPAIVQNHGLIGCSFGLFAFLGQSHTVAPYRSGEWRNWPRTIAVEALLLGLIDLLHERARQPRARILPWPNGGRWTLSVRHDVDRLLVPEEAGRLLAGHGRAGTSATWYWRASQLEADSAAGASAASLRKIASGRNQEVAHHTERLWAGAEQEQALIEATLGSPVLGTAAHGDPNCFRFQGAPNLLWSERQKHLYTEFIGHGHLHPHRAATLGGDGEIVALDVICLPHHESFDRSMTRGDTAAEVIATRRELYEQAGGLLQVLSHPDVSPDHLFDFLTALPSANRIDWTAEQAATWWRRTHVARELSARRTIGQSFEVVSRHNLEGAVLEIRFPDGDRISFMLSLAAGVPVEIEAAFSSADWQARIAPIYQRAVRQHQSRSGRTGTRAMAATLLTNSDLVPQRARVLLGLLGGLTGVSTLAGRRVLEVGSGFGALTAYLRLADTPTTITGFDRSTDLTSTARDCALEAEITEGLVYETGDVRNLTDVPDASCDVIIVNNAWSYVAGRDGARQAAHSMMRVLAPNGVVLVYQAARPRLRHAARSWRNRSRARTWRASTITGVLGDAGFVDVRAGAHRSGTVVEGLSAHVARHVGVGARKPCDATDA